MDKISPRPDASLAGLVLSAWSKDMPDYGELLRYLAEHPPRDDAERQVHASMLELIATSMREETPERVESLAHLRARYTGREAGYAHPH